MAQILVLDDIADSGAVIRKILAKKGHEVVSFTDEDEALAYAREQPLDLVILDLRLKRISGLEVLVLLQKIQPAIRALVLTGYSTGETLHRAMQLGVKEYCLKPIDKSELEDKVSSALGS